MNNNIEEIISKLGLIPHPEGGYYKEIYRSEELINKEGLPNRYDSGRNISTSIYYLLAKNQISHFHKLKSNELWHFYYGSPVIIHCLNEKDGYSRIKLGIEFKDEIFPQCTIRNGTWFAAEVENKESFSLVGCTVSPGFDFKDFEMADRNKLLELFPDQNDLIKKFTIDETD